MPLTQNTETTRKLDLPADLPGAAAGDWVELVTVYTGAMRLKAYNRSLKVTVDGEGESSDPFLFRQSILEACIHGWSDSEPVSPDAIASLHPLVQDWISTTFFNIAAGITPEEKKDSKSNSSPGSDRPASAKETSPVSSAT